MEGCAKYTNSQKHNRERGHYKHKLTMGNDAMAMSQEECCKTVRSSVKVRQVKTNIRWRDELRHQPGPRDHQTQLERCPSNLKRGRQGHRHAKSIAGSHRSSCRDYKPCSRQSPGSARRGQYVNPASSTAIAQCRKAQTYDPVRDKLRSQPGREDHQAYRYSKGSGAT